MAESNTISFSFKIVLLINIGRDVAFGDLKEVINIICLFSKEISLCDCNLAAHNDKDTVI